MRRGREGEQRATHLERVEVAGLEARSPGVVLDARVVGGVLVELLHRDERESVEGGSVALVWEAEDVEKVEEGGKVGSCNEQRGARSEEGYRSQFEARTTREERRKE